MVVHHCIRATLILLMLIVPAAGGVAQGQWELLDTPPGADVRGVVQLGDTIVVSLNGKFAGLEDAYCVSTDGGTGWSPPSTMEKGRLFTAHGRIWLLAFDDNGLFRLDASAGWVRVETSISFTAPSDVAIVGDTVFVSESSGPAGVLKSSDPSLVQWHSANAGLPKREVNCIGGGEVGSGAALLCCVRDSGLYRCGGDGIWRLLTDSVKLRFLAQIVRGADCYLAHNTRNLFRSTDGVAWVSIPTGTPCAVTGIAAEGKLMVAGTGSGLLISTDGGITWRSETMQYQSTSVTTVDIDQGRIAMGTFPYGLFLSTDEGRQWSTVPAYYSMGMNSVIEHGTDLLVGEEGFNPYRFRLSSSTWSRLSLPLEGWDRASQFFESRIYSHRSTLYFSTRNGLSQERHDWRSLDDAVTWQSCDTLHINNYRLEGAAGGEYFYFLTEHGVARTTDNGEQWSYRDAGILWFPQFVGAADGQLYVASSCELRYSTDAGDTWRTDTATGLGGSISQLLVSDSMVCVYNGTLAYRRHGDTLFQQCSNAPNGNFFLFGSTLLCWRSPEGILRYDEESDAWVHWEEGFSATGVNRLVGIISGRAFALDRQGRLWSRSLAKTTGMRPVAAVPDIELDLWPQPADEQLMLNVRGGSGRILVTVSDLLGRRCLLQEGVREQMVIPLHGLPRGIYLLAATRNDVTVRRTIIRR